MRFPTNPLSITLRLLCMGCAFTATAWMTHAQTPAPGDNRPNVLFIAIDDLRPELACYGATHVYSPNIDAVARQGFLFQRAYCQVPVCGPSRASILSGVRPRLSNVLLWTAEEFAPGQTTLPAAFKDAGYHTISRGKVFHYLNDSAERSWSEPPTFDIQHHIDYFDPSTEQHKDASNQVRVPFYEVGPVIDTAYIDGQTCLMTIKDLYRMKEEGKPFFLACGFVRPHLPFYAPKPYWDLYDRSAIAVAENPYPPYGGPEALKGSTEILTYTMRGEQYNTEAFHKVARHGYYASVSFVDGLVGHLMAALDALDLRKNTIVVIWGDHGWHLGEHSYWAKSNLLHNATHSPLIIDVPGGAGGAVVDELVELVDMYPTLCALAGIPIPPHVEGTSMVPLLQNPWRTWKKAVFSRLGLGHTVTTRDYTYTEYPDARMLFDLATDPQENYNVVSHPAYKDKALEMRQLLQQGWLQARPR